MVQSPNQFALTQERGYSDLSNGAHNVISCQIDATETGTLTAGDPVTVVASVGGVPKVIKATADTSDVFGFITNNLKDASYTAGQRVEIGIKGTVIWLTAGAAISRGARVQADISEDTVITQTGVNSIVGWAFDQAASADDLIRVYIETPVISQPMNLTDLNDVLIDTPTDTQALKYDGTDTRWENAADAT